MPAPCNPRGGNKLGRKKVASVSDAVWVPAMPADSVFGPSLSRAASSLLRLTTSSTLSSAGSIVGDVGHRMSPHHHRATTTAADSSASTTTVVIQAASPKISLSKTCFKLPPTL
jgi:hypothetical protein